MPPCGTFKRRWVCAMSVELYIDLKSVLDNPKFTLEATLPYPVNSVIEEFSEVYVDMEFIKCALQPSLMLRANSDLMYARLCDFIVRDGKPVLHLSVGSSAVNKLSSFLEAEDIEHEWYSG